ncbi:MAG: pyridoxamine 5'-phosphate oxidase family protein [Defluviicoccus sp.]
MATPPPSDRARVRRLHERGRYDRATIDAILDAMPVCHIGYSIDGLPYATPSLQWREGDRVYWHGSSASRMLRAIDGAPVCLTVTILDGFVVARSAFHHSLNYRSVMLFGRAERVSEEAGKLEHLERLIEGLFPGRWQTLRPVNAKELKATAVFSLPIDEASAKVRTGGPKDDEADYALPIWAGVVPVRLQLLPAEDDPRNAPDVSVPADVGALKIG